MLKNLKTIFISLALLTITSLLPVTGIAASGKKVFGSNNNSYNANAANENQWHFVVTPYAWLFGMNGDMTVKGSTSDVDITPIDLLKNISILDFVGQLHVEAQRGNWSFMIDPTYIKASPSATLGPINVDVTVEMTLIDFGVFYKVYQQTYPNDQAVSLELFGGGRYMYLKNEIALSAKPGAITVVGSQGWVDPIIGGRAISRITKNVFAWFRADVGGFGVSSKFTWSAIAAVGYDFNRRVALVGGFRGLGYDYSTGSGSDEFKMDMTYYGPIIGLKFQW